MYLPWLPHQIFCESNLKTCVGCESSLCVPVWGSSIQTQSICVVLRWLELGSSFFWSSGFLSCKSRVWRVQAEAMEGELGFLGLQDVTRKKSDLPESLQLLSVDINSMKCLFLCIYITLIFIGRFYFSTFKMDFLSYLG